ncbi:hypothetical protein EVAR_104007_1 [Eumeta japonica]|uniref:Uncharacterized protein n=1 Tax=Eumeta variegata TaxID=151549 RepID=A0A4C1Y0J4_EUMVA|nr:hypothetical protein EVAR_104007_1 [Eumeta japonica]
MRTRVESRGRNGRGRAGRPPTSARPGLPVQTRGGSRKPRRRPDNPAALPRSNIGAKAAMLRHETRFAESPRRAPPTGTRRPHRRYVYAITRMPELMLFRFLNNWEASTEPSHRWSAAPLAV